MENNNVYKIKNSIFHNDTREIMQLLNCGLDPNFEGGWPLRFAARNGSHSIVQILTQYGANPHLLGPSGASTLQLAVYSGEHWDSDDWNFLLSCYDSSQLADGAAVAIIFNNVSALIKILETGRCNIHIPTTLTGKTVENLAKGYKLQYLLNSSATTINQTNVTPRSSPRVARQNRLDVSNTPAQAAHRNLSPSVARFFDQTIASPSLVPQQNAMVIIPFHHSDQRTST